ncbi:transcription elongation factor GreB [Azovibrio restrictus]|uniref:transcription elongation factor GreB n=1 Tax=Azovibrio restrictus TaxID=146938 RepID=UPI0026EB2867|nr:transcription elongation factor GreB [Azovibrio restrictus]
MSKAFMREDAGDDDEDDLSPALKLPPGSKNYITPAGYARLVAEQEELIKRERPRIVEVVAWAASNGDRSENGDYLYGKKRLREIDRRIRFLSKRIDNAQVVDPTLQGDNDQIFFGATVTLCWDGSETQTYSIVGIDEADAARGRISWISPLARALIKSREGDSLRFQTPAGVREIDILEVVYQALD